MIALTIEGIAEVQKALQDLPPTLVVEGSHLIEGEANYAAYQIRSQYPAGDLQDGVTVDPVTKATAYAGFRITSRDFKAEWYKFGTAMRHTKLGWNRGQERVRPTPVFIPTMEKARATMWAGLREFLVRNGLIVTG